MLFLVESMAPCTNVYVRTYARMYVQTDGWTDGRFAGQTDGWTTDGRTDVDERRTDGWTDESGTTDGRTQKILTKQF